MAYKIICELLACCLMVGMLPAAALAQTPEVIDETNLESAEAAGGLNQAETNLIGDNQADINQDNTNQIDINQTDANQTDTELTNSLVLTEDAVSVPDVAVTDTASTEYIVQGDSPTIVALRFYYQELVIPASGGSSAVYQRTSYQPNADPPLQPRIEELGGAIQLEADLLFSDGTTLSAQDAGLTLNWQIAKSFNTINVLTGDPLASVDSNGLVTALAVGNGAVVLSCSINGITTSAVQEIKVLVSGNDTVTPLTIIGYETLFRRSNTEPWVKVNLQKPPAINTKAGQLQFGVRVNWSDGSSQDAATAGQTFAWSLLGGGSVATLSGPTLTALGVGNATATLLCTPPLAVSALGINSITVDVLITNNEIGQSNSNAQSLYLLYTDLFNPPLIPRAYNEDNGMTPGVASIPFILQEKGSCRLLPRILFDSGLEMDPQLMGWAVEWNIVSQLGFNVSSPNQAIASINPYGTVTALGTGSGIVTVSVQIPAQPQIAIQYARIVIDNQGVPYVTDIVITNEDGEAYPGAALTLADHNEVAEPYVTVNYSDGTQKCTWAGDKLEDLKWSVSDTEQAAIDELGGMFRGRPGFTQFWVKAELAQAGLLGSDVMAFLYVQSASNDENLDLHSDTLRLRVYFESDYIANGNDARLITEKTLTVGEVQSLGTITEQYTYASWNSDTNMLSTWGTMAATGVSFYSLATAMGITFADLTAMKFNMNNSINDHPMSTTALFSARYRYPQYKNGAEMNSPSSAGAYQVTPMLALRTARANFENSAATGAMLDNGRFRLCIGMYSVRDNSNRNSYKWIYGVDLIVKDEAIVLLPEEEEEPLDNEGGEGKDKGGKDEKGGIGGGVGGQKGDPVAGRQDGSTGDATDSSKATGAEQGGGGSDPKSTFSIHQIMSDSQTWFDVPDEPNPFIPVSTGLAIGAVLFGGAKAGFVFLGQRRKRKEPYS